MKSTITITAVVLVHAAFLSLVGCRSTSGFPESEPTKLTTFGGAAVPAPVADPATIPPPAQAVPVSEPVITPAPAAPVASNTALVISSQEGGAGEPVAGGRTYVVKPNESLWVIARRENTTVAALRNANGLSENAVLKVGQKLVIPASSGAAGASTAGDTAPGTVSGETYVVQKGDVLGTIARKHGTTVAKIKAANGLKSDMVRVGQKLRIPAGAAPATSEPSPAPAGAQPAAPVTRPATPPPPASVPAVPAPSTSDSDIATHGFGGFGVASPAARPATAPSPSTPPAPAVNVPPPSTTTAPAEALPVEAPTQLNY